MNTRRIALLCLPALLYFAPAAKGDPYQVLRTADSLSQAGRPDSALLLGQAVLDEHPLDSAASDSVVGWAVHRVGNYYFALGELDSARAFWQRAAELYELHGAAPVKRIGVQNNLAVLESMSGRTVRAARAFEEALQLHREAGTDTTIDAANVMNNLALMYQELGRSDEALDTFEASGRIWKQHLGELDWHVGLNIGNRGIVYAQRGQDGWAESCFRESMRIIEASLGRDHVRMAEPEGNLAAILVARGRYDDAEPLYLDALRVISGSLGHDHPDLIARLNGLGTLYRERGDLKGAEASYRRALEIAGIHGGDTSLATADQLHHLAWTLADQNRFAEADSLWDRATRIYAEQGRAESYEMLALSQARMVSARTADVRLRHRFRVVETCDALYHGQSHPARGSALLALAEMSFRDSQWTAAATLAESALTVYLNILSQNARYLNEKDALGAGARLRKSVDLCLRSVVSGGHPGTPVGVSTELSEKLSASKGLIFDLLSARTRAQRDLRHSQESSVQAEYDAARAALAGQFARVDSWSVAGDRHTADSLRSLADSLETELALELGKQSPQLVTRVPLGEFFVQHPDAAVVEYFRLGAMADNGDSAERYVALVRTPAAKGHVIDLGWAKDVDSLVAGYRSHLLDLARRPGVPGLNDLEAYRSLAATLRTRVWDPVATHLTLGSGNDGRPPLCDVVADGQLGLVSLGTLPDGTHDYLADRFSFRYLASMRDWSVREVTPGSNGTGLLAVGDPAFDSEATTPNPSSGHLVLRSANMDCSLQANRSTARLPLSRWEAEQVTEDWNRTHDDSAVLLLGNRATEESFRSEARGKRVLHIATHGFYLDPACGSQAGTARDEAHPLLLSGLLLAGANRRDQALTSESDGILSAYEVSALDLRSAGSVVLSACESGLGTHVASEGLYGLRHAFRLAGARDVVCSLWPVSDRITAALMSRLYKGEGESLARRLDDIQAEERKRLKRERQADHPLTWGAFIVFGSVD